ncbi:MAG: cell division transport system permease protein [Solirubrobacterales bacterium]|jgi:cell division transport system permease protein|nr:cell division transport system permease protein [Solirubrobacterales bacterium]
MGRIVFFFQEALRALKRNGAPSLAAIVTTVVTVVLLGMLIPIFQTAQGKSDEVRDQLNIQYALYDDATKAEIAALKGKLEGVPHVAEVTFISKDEALATLKGELDDKTIVEELHTNPLPNSFEVKADDAANLPSVEETVFPNGTEGKPFDSIISNPFDRTQSSEKIEQVTSALKIVLTVITALLILASLMLVGNTIRLSIYTRRREVEVMRLVGATRWFIRWPFMIEGVVVGFAGGLLAILILWLGKITVVDPLSDSIGVLAAQNNSTLGFPALVAILFAASIVVSTIGSGVTLRRFLKV